MSVLWGAGDEAIDPAPSFAGWVRLALRLVILVPVLVVLLVFLLLVNAVERVMVGPRRPVSSWFPMLFSRVFFPVIGMRHISRGAQMKAEGAVVANHSSWLDILSLNARKRVFFVSKDEVAGWPGIGFLARAAGTVFIRRDKRDARGQIALFERRLHAGHKLLFFPEGTSSDSLRVLPFKTTLFAAFFAEPLVDFMQVQPVSVIYRAPKGADPRFYGWWGDMPFGANFLKVIAAWPQGSVEVVYHPPVRVSDFADRKALARHCELAVRSALPRISDQNAGETF